MDGQTLFYRTLLATAWSPKISINFSKANRKVCLGLHCNGDEMYLYVNKKEIFKFKAKDNISWYNFCFGSISKDFTKDKQSEISLNGTVYDFPVDHNSTKKRRHS